MEIYLAVIGQIDNDNNGISGSKKLLIMNLQPKKPLGNIDKDFNI